MQEIFIGFPLALIVFLGCDLSPPQYIDVVKAFLLVAFRSSPCQQIEVFLNLKTNDFQLFIASVDCITQQIEILKHFVIKDSLGDRIAN